MVVVVMITGRKQEGLSLGDGSSWLCSSGSSSSNVLSQLDLTQLVCNIMMMVIIADFFMGTHGFTVACILC